MKRLCLILISIIFCITIQSQIFESIHDSMRIVPDKERIKNNIAKQQKNPDSNNYKYTKNIKPQDVDSAVIINLIAIYPDTINRTLKHEVNNKRFYVYFPSTSKLYYYWTDLRNSEEFGYSFFVEVYSSIIERQLKYMRNRVNKGSVFLIAHFPLDRGRHHCIAYKAENANYYIYCDMVYDKYFETHQEMIDYYFYNTDNYIDIYKKRVNSDYKGLESRFY